MWASSGPSPTKAPPPDQSVSMTSKWMVSSRDAFDAVLGQERSRPKVRQQAVADFAVVGDRPKDVEHLDRIDVLDVAIGIEALEPLFLLVHRFRLTASRTADALARQAAISLGSWPNCSPMRRQVVEAPRPARRWGWARNARSRSNAFRADCVAIHSRAGRLWTGTIFPLSGRPTWPSRIPRSGLSCRAIS